MHSQLILASLVTFTICSVYGFEVCPNKIQYCDDGICCKRNLNNVQEFVCCKDSCNSVNCQLASVNINITAEVIDKHLCQDQITKCSDSETCCPLLSGRDSCCPLVDAVCCSDFTHCCPENSICFNDTCLSVLTGKHQDLTVLEENKQEELCPDNKSWCKSRSRCIALNNDKFGCCSFQDGILCPNHDRCCPNGYKCTPDSVFCIDKSNSNNNASNAYIMPSKKVISTHKHMEKEEMKKLVASNSRGNSICPDAKSECPDGYTCCELPGGGYGCCPYNNAVCCSDREHCCPQGMTCDLIHSTCLNSKTSMPMKKKIPAIPRKISDDLNNVLKKVNITTFNVKSVVCPDQESQCPNGYTCCKLPAGDYGCCPYDRAVCCSDHEHCCPHGMTCDLSTSTCRTSRTAIPMKKKISAIPRKTFTSDKFNKDMKKIAVTNFSSNSVVCPDQESQCPNGYTCCKMPSGDYGCCPFDRAVCCSDQVHCCPHGMTCDLATSTCQKSEVPIVMKKKVKAASMKSLKGSARPLFSFWHHSKFAFCPDKIKKCLDSSTCCKLPGGDYGCCHYKNAVCCADNIHCCPAGKKCISEGCQ